MREVFLLVAGLALVMSGAVCPPIRPGTVPGTIRVIVEGILFCADGCISANICLMLLHVWLQPGRPQQKRLQIFSPRRFALKQLG